MQEQIQHLDAASGHPTGGTLPPFLTPDLTLLLLTWVTFFALLAVLYKFAWKPILAALDNRERSIRQSLDDVERIKQEVGKIDETCVRLLADAEAKSKVLLEQSQKTARNAAGTIEKKAREEAKISLENAIRDINEATLNAQMRLREEGAQIAVELAGKLIKENMDADKNQKIINRFIKDI